MDTRHSSKKHCYNAGQHRGALSRIFDHKNRHLDLPRRLGEVFREGYPGQNQRQPEVTECRPDSGAPVRGDSSLAVILPLLRNSTTSLQISNDR